MHEDQMYDILVNELGVNEDTIRIVCHINGTSENTYKDILYAVAGYRDFNQLDGHENFYNN